MRCVSERSCLWWVVGETDCGTHLIFPRSAPLTDKKSVAFKVILAVDLVLHPVFHQGSDICILCIRLYHTRAFYYFPEGESLMHAASHNHDINQLLILLSRYQSPFLRPTHDNKNTPYTSTRSEVEAKEGKNLGTNTSFTFSSKQQNEIRSRGTPFPWLPATRPRTLTGAHRNNRE